MTEEWHELPSNFMSLSATERLELVLRLWIRLQLARPELGHYTHARAEFDWHGSGCNAVRWSLLVADDQAITVDHAVNLGPTGAAAVNGMVEPWTAQVDGDKLTHGRLTFNFNRSSVGLDLFDAHNNTLFAHYLVKKVSH